jgi:hypothetical protein
MIASGAGLSRAALGPESTGLRFDRRRVPNADARVIHSRRLSALSTAR